MSKKCKIINDDNGGTLIVDGVAILFSVRIENGKSISVEYFKEHYLSLGYTVEHCYYAPDNDKNFDKNCTHTITSGNTRNIKSYCACRNPKMTNFVSNNHCQICGFTSAPKT